MLCLFQGLGQYLEQIICSVYEMHKCVYILKSSLLLHWENWSAQNIVAPYFNIISKNLDECAHMLSLFSVEH